MDDLVKRLRRAADNSSRTHRAMAEAKSLRQESNVERRTDLYAWPTPEQTIEGRALARIQAQAAEIARLREALVQAKLGEGRLGEAIISDKRDDGSPAFGFGMEATIDAILAILTDTGETQ